MEIGTDHTIKERKRNKDDEDKSEDPIRGMQHQLKQIKRHQGEGRAGKNSSHPESGRILANERRIPSSFWRMRGPLASSNEGAGHLSPCDAVSPNGPKSFAVPYLISWHDRRYRQHHEDGHREKVQISRDLAEKRSAEHSPRMLTTSEPLLAVGNEVGLSPSSLEAKSPAALSRQRQYECHRFPIRSLTNSFYGLCYC